ncbi:MAG: O-antigen/teichoic acid export membrane protein [Dokdonia sp.]|jgi:O-antigen/teichoic acid export membrane protein
MRLAILNKIKANASKLVVLSDQALVSGVNFLVTLLLARFLGLDDFGLFAFGWMVALFFSSVQLAFIISPLFTLFPKHEAPDQYLKSVHSLQLIFTAITFILAFGIVKVVMVIKPEWYVLGTDWSLPLVASLFGLQDFYRRVNITQGKPFQTLVSDIIAYGFQPFAVFGLYYLELLNIHHSYVALALLYGFSAIYNACRNPLESSRRQIQFTAKENWVFSKYLVGTALLQWVSGNFFIIAAGTLLAPLAIGVIRIAQNVVGVLNVLFSALENIVPLKAAQLLANYGSRPTLNYFKTTLLYGGAFTISVLVGIALGRDLIIDWFYGPEYLTYSNVFLGFTLIYVFVFLNTILGFVIRTFEMNRIFLISYVFTAVFSVLAAKPIINQWGVYGVIIGLLGTQVLNIGVYTYYLKSKCIELWK